MEDKERMELIREFFELYRAVQKKATIKMHSHFDAKDNYIEIWEYKRSKAVRNICRTREEEEITCWRRALDDIRRYEKTL